MRCLWILGVIGALAMPAAAAVETGKARGIVTVGEAPTALAHVVARLEERANGVFTVVTLSNVPLDRALAADAAALAAKAKKGEVVAVEVTIEDATGRAFPQVLFAKVGRLESEADGVWISQEFTDQIAEGQVKSAEELRSGSTVWSYDADFRALLPGDPSADLELGQVSGDFSLQGKPIALGHVRAWLVNDETGDGTGTRVLVSTAAVDLETARNEAALWALVESDGLVALSILIDDETGSVESQTFLAPGLPARLSTGVGSRWSKWEFTDDVVRGSVNSDGRQELFDLIWEYTLYFAAPIE